MRGAAAVGVIVLISTPAALAQQLFKCTTKDGHTVYQDSKCPEESRQSVVKPPSAPAAEPCPTALFEKPQARQQEIEQIVDMLVNYEGCSAGVPGFAARFAAAYRDWHQRSHDAFARYEAHPVARRMVECRVEQEGARLGGDAGAREYKANICMQMIGPAIEKVARDGMPSDVQR
jgi:hypothetical protein